MKSLALVYALSLLAGAGALEVESTPPSQRQDPAELVSRNPQTIGETTRNSSNRSAKNRMEDRQITALSSMMDAVSAGDARRYAKLYAEDAVITIYGGGVIKGRDAIERYEVELLREFPGARLAFYSVWQKGNLAVVHYGVNGRTPAGQAMGHEGLLFYRFHPSGIIEEERRYLDSLTPMAQLGMLGATPARALPTLPTEMKVHAARGSRDERANIETVKSSFAALDSRNEPEFLKTIADDAVVDEMILAQPFTGKRNVKSWFETWTRAVPDATSEFTTLLGVGDFVLVEIVLRGTLKGPFGRLVASDRPFAVHRAAVIHLKNGKLRHLAAFMNGKEIAESVGQWPPPVGK